MTDQNYDASLQSVNSLNVKQHAVKCERPQHGLNINLLCVDDHCSNPIGRPICDHCLENDPHQYEQHICIQFPEDLQMIKGQILSDIKNGIKDNIFIDHNLIQSESQQKQLEKQNNEARDLDEKYGEKIFIQRIGSFKEALQSTIQQINQISEFVDKIMQNFHSFERQFNPKEATVNYIDYICNISKYPELIDGLKVMEQYIKFLPDQFEIQQEKIQVSTRMISFQPEMNFIQQIFQEIENFIQLAQSIDYQSFNYKNYLKPEFLRMNLDKVLRQHIDQTRAIDNQMGFIHLEQLPTSPQAMNPEEQTLLLKTVSMELTERANKVCDYSNQTKKLQWKSFREFEKEKWVELNAPGPRPFECARPLFIYHQIQNIQCFRCYPIYEEYQDKLQLLGISQTLR